MVIKTSKYFFWTHSDKQKQLTFIKKKNIYFLLSPPPFILPNCFLQKEFSLLAVVVIQACCQILFSISHS